MFLTFQDRAYISDTSVNLRYWNNQHCSHQCPSRNIFIQFSTVAPTGWIFWETYTVSDMSCHVTTYHNHSKRNWLSFFLPLKCQDHFWVKICDGSYFWKKTSPIWYFTIGFPAPGFFKLSFQLTNIHLEGSDPESCRKSRHFFCFFGLAFGERNQSYQQYMGHG